MDGVDVGLLSHVVEVPVVRGGLNDLDVFINFQSAIEVIQYNSFLDKVDMARVDGADTDTPSMAEEEEANELIGPLESPVAVQRSPHSLGAYAVVDRRVGLEVDLEHYRPLDVGVEGIGAVLEQAYRGVLGVDAEDGEKEGVVTFLGGERAW